jgi:hypothetical protein
MALLAKFLPLAVLRSTQRAIEKRSATYRQKVANTILGSIISLPLPFFPALITHVPDGTAYKKQESDKNGPDKGKIDQHDPRVLLLEHTHQRPTEADETKYKNQNVKFQLSQ